MRNTFVVLCLAPTLLWAQQDRETRDILEKISNRYNKPGLYQLDFRYNMRNASADIDETLDGTLYFQKSGYRFVMDAQELYCDNETLWIYLKESKEVNVQYAKMGEDAALQSVRGVLNLYKQGFKYRQVRQKGNEVEIELVPEDKTKPYFKIVLSANVLNYRLLGFTIVYKNDNKYSYRVRKEYEIAEEKEADFFRFQAGKYPEVEVIDLR